MRLPQWAEIPVRRDAGLSSGADVRLFCADLDSAGAQPTSGWLSENEYARLAKLRDPLLRRRFMARRILLRHLISKECGLPAREVTYCHGRYGKPAVANLHENQSFYFNTSTSEAWHTIAMSYRGPVGVDIEAMRRRIDYAQVLRVAASAEELSWYRRAKPEVAGVMAMKIWVIKEAILKAAGRGLSVNPQKISLPRDLVIFDARASWTKVNLPGFKEPIWVQVIPHDQTVLALARYGTTY